MRRDWSDRPGNLGKSIVGLTIRTMKKNINKGEPCPICHGQGVVMDSDDPCTGCDGTGKVGGWE